MTPIECLLDEHNPTMVEGVPLGVRVRDTGKRHLWDERPAPGIDTIVIHCISAVGVCPEAPFSREAILRIFCDYGVSSHYLVERDGGVLRLVPETMRAWHCGGSIMPEPDNRTAVNAFSLGLELVATPESGFTDAQYTSLLGLCSEIRIRHGSGLTLLGHEHVAGDRAVALKFRELPKTDPGPLFDWSRVRVHLPEFRVL
jgi:N-acetyl-anhydromuramyl-L-alanine amidase AmpD